MHDMLPCFQLVYPWVQVNPSLRRVMPHEAACLQTLCPDMVLLETHDFVQNLCRLQMVIPCADGFLCHISMLVASCLFSFA